MFARWFSRKKTLSRITSFKPTLEILEQRQVLSVSSPTIHAVADNYGNTASFYISQSQAGKFLYESPYKGAANTLLINPLAPSAGKPASIDSFSAGLDPTGHPDLFVKAGDSSLWEYKQNQGWRQILGPNQVESFAAVKGGRLYAQFTDNTLHEFDDSFWYLVPGSGPVQSLDAVTDNFNQDAVFLKLTDGTFREFYHGNYQQLAGIGHIILPLPNGGYHVYTYPLVSSFSAGLDITGHADVFARFWSGDLENNVNGAWTKVAAPGTYKQFSATDDGAVWVISSNNTLQEYDYRGVRSDIAEPYYSFSSISAATSHDVWVVNQSQILQEWNGSSWSFWTDLLNPGPVQQ